MSIHPFYYLDDSQFDHDKHESRCDCGLCAGNGTSYGCSIYAMTPEGVRAYLDPFDRDVFMDWLSMEAEPYSVVYSSSEESAIEAAFQEAEENHLLLLEHASFVPTEKGALWFLTNGLMESTHLWSEKQFQELGLVYTEASPWDGERYPLTAKEWHYIADESASFSARGGIVCFGYTVLWQGEKWLCPTIEYQYEDVNDPAEIEQLSEEKDWWQLRFADLGISLVEEYLPDRYVLGLAFPFPVIMQKFSDFPSWKEEFLRRVQR